MQAFGLASCVTDALVLMLACADETAAGTAGSLLARGLDFHAAAQTPPQFKLKPSLLVDVLRDAGRPPRAHVGAMRLLERLLMPNGPGLIEILKVC